MYTIFIRSVDHCLAIEKTQTREKGKKKNNMKKYAKLT